MSGGFVLTSNTEPCRRDDILAAEAAEATALVRACCPDPDLILEVLGIVVS